MRRRFEARYLRSIITIALAAAAGAVISATITGTSGQTPQMTRPDRIEGKPNFSGI
jgi:hypothetical protein